MSEFLGVLPYFTFQGCVYGRSDQRFVGEDARSKRGVLAIKYPIEFGFILNMDDMELVLSYTMHDQLGICPQDHPVLLSQAPFNPKSTRESVTQIMFEQFDVPAFSLQTSAVLVLHSTERSTGVAVDLGGGAFTASVVIDGYFSKEASLTLPLSGRYITQYFKTDMEKSEHITVEQKEMLGGSSFWEIINDIKQSCCFVSQNFDTDTENSVAHAQQCELPDGTFLTLDKERFRCTEAIFNPDLFGVEMQGIQHQAYNSVMRAPSEATKTLLSNIVLCGGSSMFPGIVTRLENDLKNLNKTEHEINLVAPEDRDFCVWKGGSKMAETVESRIWLSKTDYDEYGPSRIHEISS